MSKSRPGTAGFRRETYAETAAGMQRLFARLPERDVRVVAEEALTRLSRRVARTPARGTPPAPERIEDLCKALLSEDPEAGAAVVARLVAQGATLETVYLDYLAPAARLFGTQWDRDEASFMDVTIGTGRILAILRALSDPVAQPGARAALFAAVPGEDHRLGVRMAADLFRQRGWDIELALEGAHEALLERVRQTGHRRIGLSAAGSHSALALTRLIVALRAQDPDCFILVSGEIVRVARDLVDAAMPDGVATDLDTAERLLFGR